MRIIHGAGYSDSDRAQFRVLVYRNILLGMSLLVEAMDNLKISYANAANKVRLIVVKCPSIMAFWVLLD